MVLKEHIYNTVFDLILILHTLNKITVHIVTNMLINMQILRL